MEVAAARQLQTAGLMRQIDRRYASVDVGFMRQIDRRYPVVLRFLFLDTVRQRKILDTISYLQKK